jgi:hypothetical protein
VVVAFALSSARGLASKSARLTAARCSVPTDCIGPLLLVVALQRASAARWESTSFCSAPESTMLRNMP